MWCKVLSRMRWNPVPSQKQQRFLLDLEGPDCHNWVPTSGLQAKPTTSQKAVSHSVKMYLKAEVGKSRRWNDFKDEYVCDMSLLWVVVAVFSVFVLSCKLILECQKKEFWEEHTIREEARKMERACIFKLYENQILNKNICIYMIYIYLFSYIFKQQSYVDINTMYQEIPINTAWRWMYTYSYYTYHPNVSSRSPALFIVVFSKVGCVMPCFHFLTPHHHQNQRSWHSWLYGQEASYRAYTYDCCMQMCTLWTNAATEGQQSLVFGCFVIETFSYWLSVLSNCWPWYRRPMSYLKSDFNTINNSF